MTIAIVGATGNFGGDIIDALLARDVAPDTILALGRNQDRLDQLAPQGLRTARVDLDDPAGVEAALTGVETVLLISVGAPGKGLAPRRTVATSAQAAGVGHLVYTSALQAPTTKLVLAAEHKATEELITATGIPATFLRNGWYTENHRQDFAAAQQRGVIANSVGAGRLATAPRRDFAEAAAVVLTTPGHEGKAYELSGDSAWDYTEFAATAAEVLGRSVEYQPLTTEQERDQLLAAGLDEQTVGFINLLNGNMADGVFAHTSGDLSRLIGHPTEPLSVTLRSWA
jgi:NAD(P)H dehydrogenase (quinone)